MNKIAKLSCSEQCGSCELFAEPPCISDAQFVSYMESVYAYVYQKTKLDPNQGVELSAEGVVIEVEKMKDQEKKDLKVQLQKTQEIADELESEFDDDKSEDWMPTKGFVFVSFKRGGG